MNLTYKWLALALIVLLSSCSKSSDEPQVSGARLIFKFKFDSTQVRLGNLGQPATIVSGNAAQSPKFNSMSSHYIELAPNALTQLGSGAILFHAAETTKGGENAIDFSKNKSVGNGEEFFSVPLSEVKAGTYEWLRVSLAYQNYDIIIKNKNPLDPSKTITATGTVASFIGFNTFVESFKIKNTSLTVNSNKKQGFWAFEVFNQNLSGDAAATTVVNPIANTSPVPKGSCVVTGAFDKKLVITGNETKDIIVEVSLSTNKSFEWKEAVNDGYFQPDAGEIVQDMGIRGMMPLIK